VLVILGFIAAQLLSRAGALGGREPVVVGGYLGGEKESFLKDQDVQAILRDRYGLTVDGTTLGSLEMVSDAVRLTDDDDFLWPSSQVAAALYRQRQGKVVKFENIFNSPIVLYSWTPVTDALIRQGIVRKEGEAYYVTDLSRLVGAAQERKRWSELGVPQLTERVSVRSSDPVLSNSGNMFFGLLANTLNGGSVVNTASLPRVLPQLKAYRDAQGFMEQRSSDLFQQYLTTGMGAYPLVAGYESQMIEFGLQNEQVYSAGLKDRVRILYPKPTVWSSHPLIARTPEGARLLDALKDPEIQRIAWERHGFRSGLAGVQNDPKVLKVIGVPATVDSITEMPGPDVMNRIIAALKG
jgi:hypothetical protein